MLDNLFPVAGWVKNVNDFMTLELMYVHVMPQGRRRRISNSIIYQLIDQILTDLQMLRDIDEFRSTKTKTRHTRHTSSTPHQNIVDFFSADLFDAAGHCQQAAKKGVGALHRLICLADITKSRQ